MSGLTRLTWSASELDRLTGEWAPMDLTDVTDELSRFTAERDWERFHDPKNLAMALAAESGELIEIFQWKTTDEVRGPLTVEETKAAAEIADILIYLIRLADVLDIDLDSATKAKIASNAERLSRRASEGQRRQARSE